MSSTNKTTNYELSQFVGSDKPAWLADYNQDMSKIDAGIHAAQSAATAADGKADTNTSNIGDMTYLATTAKNTLVAAINEVDSDVQTAQNTANSASTAASTANLNIAKFNLVNKSTLTPTINLGTVDPLTSLQFATDNTNSVFKVYGRLRINNLNNISGKVTVKVGETSLRPSQAYQINSGVIMTVRSVNDTITAVGSRNIKVDTNGSIYIVTPLDETGAASLDGATSVLDFIISPCLYFNSDFGDA